jgi:hypothetical protein
VLCCTDIIIYHCIKTRQTGEFQSIKWLTKAGQPEFDSTVRKFLFRHNVQTSSWTHSASYSIVPGPISCDKWSEDEADPSFLASSSVKNVWSYFCRPRCKIHNINFFLLLSWVWHILTLFHDSHFPHIYCSLSVVPWEMMNIGFTVFPRHPKSSCALSPKNTLFYLHFTSNNTLFWHIHPCQFVLDPQIFVLKQWHRFQYLFF